MSLADRVPCRAAWALALALLAGPARGSAAGEPWSLDRAVAAALQRSPDSQIARARIEAAQALVAQSQSAWLPQVSVAGRYSETNSPMLAFGSILNQRAFNSGLDFNSPGRIDDLNASGTVAYNLYSGGRASAARNAARAVSDAAAGDWQETRNQLAADVVRAVLNLRKAREAVRAVDSGVGALGASVAVARARFDAGQMLKSDLLGLEVQLAQTRETLAEARHGAALAERAFLFLLGITPDGGTVELVDDDPALARLSEPDTRDFSRRPELAAMEARVRAAEAMVDSARGGSRPAVNAFATCAYDQGWVLDHHGDSWLAGVAVDLNVFDGGQTAARVRQARAELAQAREMLRKAALGVGLEVEQARLAHADAAERLAVSVLAVGQADEGAQLCRARFGREAVLSSELIGAESRLIEARLRRAAASADERAALVEMRRSLGLDPLPAS